MKLTVVFLTMSIFSFFIGCSRSSPNPPGYDWMLERYGGDQIDRSDLGKVVELGSQWISRWQSSLAFFTAELSSTEPRRIKTGMYCLANFAMGMDMAQLSEADRAQFAKDFPGAKLKQILAEHPEWDPWISAIRMTSFAEQFPYTDEPEPNPRQ